MRNLHFFQHVPYEGPGSVIDWAVSNKYSISCTKFYKNEDLPHVDAVDLLVIMGGPMGIYDETKFQWLVREKEYIRRFLKTGKPVLGICLGAQLLADALGGKIRANKSKEIGWWTVRKKNDHPFISDFPDEFKVFHWHGDTFDIPVGAINLFSSSACEHQAFIKENAVGFQFHPEATPETVCALVENCGNELEDVSQWIQTKEVIIEYSGAVRTPNKYLSAMLDLLMHSE